MRISKDYAMLMEYYNLPERFRAGDFGLLEDEIAVLREFVDNFYEAVQLLLTYAFMKCYELRNARKKQQRFSVLRVGRQE